MSDVLLLNADAQPTNYLPLSLISWKASITYLWMNKVTVLDWYDDWLVRSTTWETKVPAVVMLKKMQRRRAYSRFSKNNLFIRDLYTCQYCSKLYGRIDLTIDHVVPLSRGGKTTWDNVVAACVSCNSKKANKTDMKLKRAPYKPDYFDLVAKCKRLDLPAKHKSWSIYIS